MLDLSKPHDVIAEAERRARLRAEGRPLHGDGGIARVESAPEAPRRRRAPEGGSPSVAQSLPERAAVWNADATDGRVTIGDPPVAWRRGDVLWLLIPATARPKKNSTHLGIGKSPAYTRFKHAVIGAVAPFARELRLPLPPIDYNCAAHFYRERDDADTDNLISGLADALQDAGVIADDYHLRTWDGTDRFLDVARPRVELTLTPYLAGHR